MLEVLYRDESLLALNKPSGVALFADRTGDTSYWETIRSELDGVQPLPVHRLDKGTSGVLLVALTRERQAALNRALQARRVQKWYVARVVGAPALKGTGTIDLPLRKGRKSRYRVAGLREDIERHGDRWALRRTGADAHESVTRLRIIRRAATYSVAILHPLTGRTHQLRVHLAWIGHPIQGDHLYGRPDDTAQRWPRLALHCHRIGAPGILPTITAPCPDAFGIGGTRKR